MRKESWADCADTFRPSLSEARIAVEPQLDVGSHAAHPTLCGRCVEAVKQFKA
jgi:hypothetical protein